MEYIERQKVIDCLWYNCDEKCSAIVPDVEALPVADVVPVVRCKDCFAFDAGEESCSVLQTKTGGGFFCAYGHRRA